MRVVRIGLMSAALELIRKSLKLVTYKDIEMRWLYQIWELRLKNPIGDNENVNLTDLAVLVMINIYYVLINKQNKLRSTGYHHETKNIQWPIWLKIFPFQILQIKFNTILSLVMILLRNWGHGVTVLHSNHEIICIRLFSNIFHERRI